MSLVGERIVGQLLPVCCCGPTGQQYVGMPVLCGIFKKYAKPHNTKYGTELLEIKYPISFHMMVTFCWQPDG